MDQLTRTKKLKQLNELLQELIDDADATGKSFNLDFSFQQDPGRGDLAYRGGGEWAHSTC